MKKYSITIFETLKTVKSINRKDKKKSDNKMSCRKWVNED